MKSLYDYDLLMDGHTLLLLQRLIEDMRVQHMFQIFSPPSPLVRTTADYIGERLRSMRRGTRLKLQTFNWPPLESQMSLTDVGIAIDVLHFPFLTSKR